MELKTNRPTLNDIFFVIIVRSLVRERLKSRKRIYAHPNVPLGILQRSVGTDAYAL